MTPEEKHYWNLSEVYLSAYQNNIEPSFKIMQAMGVIVELESDLILFEKSKGKTEKSINQQRRIDILKKAVDAFSVVSDRNLQFNYVMGSLYENNRLQTLKIAELENELNKLKALLEAL